MPERGKHATRVIGAGDGGRSCLGTDGTAIMDQLPADTIARNEPPEAGGFAGITEVNCLSGASQPCLVMLMPRISSSRAARPRHPPKCSRQSSPTVGLDEKLARELDDLQHEARKHEMAMISPWSFLGVSLFMEPHGAGRQWRWLLTSRLLTLTVSRGTFNDLIAQVRFSSEFLWSQEWCGDALFKVHAFLMSLFGESLHLQVSDHPKCSSMRCMNSWINCLVSTPTAASTFGGGVLGRPK